MLSRSDALHHLLRVGLLSSNDLVERSINVSEYFSRNHLLSVENDNGTGFVIKEPRSADEDDSATMRMEATLSWLSASDPDFAPLKEWLPRYCHYDELEKILTVEFVGSSQPLSAILISGTTLDPAVLRNLGVALATLHGPVSAAAASGPAGGLFQPSLPWVLSLGSSSPRYRPPTAAAAAVLGQVFGNPAVMRALADLRSQWRSTQIIHGDVKSTNILVLKNGGVRLLDWELASLGDGAWDLAGMLHSLLAPSPRAHAEPLGGALARAKTAIDALWAGYDGWNTALRPDPGARARAFQMAGARLLQTCLECAASPGPLPRSILLLLETAAALLDASGRRR